MGTSLLLNEAPLQVLPTLAVAIGLNEAIALQQLHFLLNRPGNGKVLADGERYIFNTYAQWREFFPFWSEPTIKRVFADLEERGLVVTCQPDGVMSRRKYYRIAGSALAHLTYERVAEQAPERTKSSDERIKLIPSGTDQIDPIVGSSCAVPLTEKTSENTSETQSKGEEEKPKSPLQIEAEGFVDWFLALLKETGAPDPKMTPATRASWADSYEKLRRIDERAKTEIVSVCRWARSDPFWSGNFMSPAKLRQKNRDQVFYYDLFLNRMKGAPQVPAKRSEYSGAF